jgi:hypothetical protein
VAITFAVLVIALILGLVPGSMITSAISGGSKNRGPVALGISIGIGFAVSSIAAAWAFGLFGANNYLTILIVLTLVSLALLIVPGIRKTLVVWKEFGRMDALLLLVPFVTAFYSRRYRS